MTYAVWETTDGGWIVVKLGPPCNITLAYFTDHYAADRLAAELNR